MPESVLTGPLPELPAKRPGLYAIHYSQELAAKCLDRVPTVSAILVQSVFTGQQVAFAACRLAMVRGIAADQLVARLPELEKMLLEQFFAFVAERPESTWLHWGMHWPSFGFDVLDQRACYHGVNPVEIPDSKRFDLSHYLKVRYGEDYAPDPRFGHAIQANFGVSGELLSAEDAAVAWKNCQHAAILNSLAEKVNAVVRLYGRALDGTFKTCKKAVRPRWDQETRTLYYSGQVVKKFRQQSCHQETILATFEDDGWPSRIDDPLTGGADTNGSQRLRDAIRNLNNQFTKLLVFSSDGRQGILWCPVNT